MFWSNKRRKSKRSITQRPTALPQIYAFIKEKNLHIIPIELSLFPFCWAWHRRNIVLFHSHITSKKHDNNTYKKKKHMIIMGLIIELEIRVFMMQLNFSERLIYLRLLFLKCFADENLEDNFHRSWSPLSKSNLHSLFNLLILAYMITLGPFGVSRARK